MEHVSDINVNRQINRFIRTQSRSFLLAKIISLIMQQSFSALTLAKLEHRYLVNGHNKGMINEVSKAAIGELFDRELTEFDDELVNTAWKLAYSTGFTTEKPRLH